MLRRINLKLIFLFFVAMWLFGHAGRNLGFLQNPVLVEKIRQSQGDMELLRSAEIEFASISNLLLASGIFKMIGLIIGLVISFRICKIRKWYWINPGLAFLFVLVIGFVQIGFFKIVEHLLRMPGENFNGIGVYLINGSIGIFLGLVVFSLIYYYPDLKVYFSGINRKAPNTGLPKA